MAARREEIRDTLRQRIISGLHLGILKPGDRLPSARETSVEFGADYRVVVAAFREIELDGLVEVRPRSGITVTMHAGQPKTLLPMFAGRVVDVLTDQVIAGVPAPEFPERVRKCLETLRLRAACIEDNDDQIGTMCNELTIDYGFECTGHDVATLRPGAALPIEIRRADLLVTTAFHATAVKRLARQLQKPYVVIALPTAFRQELFRLVAQGPVYFVGTDPRFAEKLTRVIYHDVPGAANVRPVILGRDDPDAVPPNAPVLVMPTARKRLGDMAITRRTVPLARGFSRETVRELLTFIVQSNVAAMMALPGGDGAAREPDEDAAAAEE